MMSIPFFGVALALVFAAFRARGVAVMLVLLSLAATLVLFNAYVTASLGLDL
ncbi:DUF5993 family protein [Acuticoccus mangrovi]|uniref:Uncharacterized protein n=1 Tax=Acuticoccus mangrovi TaxID=2796142 RepID=A0A934IN99_9HYPH|nr:DUF5993 family protein [Acuticoccus mangrovi]MBJ3775508.1 hypothetical protein [Acuticoccus mangrovi]